MIEWFNSLLQALDLSWYQSAPFILFASAFLSATLLPGSSEATLLATLSSTHYSGPELIVIATFGNALGGMVNYFIGLWLPHRTNHYSRSQTSIEWLSRYGYWALLLSWLPLIGDLLCLAAGWLRMKFIPSFICIFIGKAARYSLVTAAFYGLW